MLETMRYVKQSRFRCTPAELFAFHERPDALALLTPPFAPVRVISPAPSLAKGAEAVLELGLAGPFKVRWHARHTVYEPPHRFVDVQVAGPFRAWRHEHIVRAGGDGAVLIDQVDFELPLRPLSNPALPIVRAQLEKMFTYRHAVTRRHVER